MDNETIYALIGIGIFSSVAYIILRSDGPNEDTNRRTRDDIIDEYKKELTQTLNQLDTQARIAKKSELLKRISGELSRNIFFEEEEVREVILDLAENY